METEIVEQPDTSEAKLANDSHEAAARESQVPEKIGTWSRLHHIDRVAVFLTLVVVAAVTIPSLPPGICFHDSGELQLASTVLGITHAPGYPGFVSLGYLATLVPGVDPAYMVTLAYLISGFVVIWLCVMMQVRLGAHALIACGVALAFIAVPRVWKNMLAPEVYMPSLAFVAGAAYLLIKYTRLGRRRDLYIAALLFGIAFADRPPILFSAPFFIITWWFARRRWDSSWRQSVKAFTVLTACAIAPLIYSLGYLYVRDTTETPYNYIENAFHESERVPPLHEGWKAKIQRVVYHATAQEFSYAMGNSWEDVFKKVKWLYGEFFLYSPIKFGVVAVIFLTGAVIVYRRCAPAFWLLISLVLGSLVFVCAYDMHGQAADYTPLVWTAYVFGGAALSWALARISERRRSLLAASFAAVVGTLVVLEADDWEARSLRTDATRFVEALDLATLPENAVICVEWPETPTLFYAMVVLTGRQDIRLISAQQKHWLRLLEPVRNRPTFVTEKAKSVRGQQLTPYRFMSVHEAHRSNPEADLPQRPTLWRLEYSEKTNPPATP